MSLLELVAVSGHFVSYTFILTVIRNIVSLRKPNLAWWLVTYESRTYWPVSLMARTGQGATSFCRWCMWSA